MLVLRSALFLASAAVLVGQYIRSRSRGKRPAAGGGYAFKSADEVPIYGGAPLPYPHADFAVARRSAEQQLHTYLREHYRAPAKAKATRPATVAFHVEEDGSMHHLRLVKDPGHGVGKAALAAVRDLAVHGERWRPAFREGLPVRFEVFLHLPVA